MQLQVVTAPIYLANGQIVFTQFEDTIIPMPTGDYAVLSLQVTPPPPLAAITHRHGATPTSLVVSLLYH
jgi:hypothetical protein